jgi:hypothetical protein
MLAPKLGFGEGAGEVGVNAHDFTGGPHFRAEHGVDAGEACERHHRFFHGHVLWLAAGGVEIFELGAGHHLGGDLGDRGADGFGHKRHGAAGARVHLDQEDLAVLYRELHIHQALHADRLGERDGFPAQLVDDVFRQRMRRQGAGAVAGVHAGFFDMLHHAGHPNVFAVANRVHVDFRRVGQIAGRAGAGAEPETCTASRM